MIRIAIVDDEAECVEKIAEYLDTFSLENKVDFKTKTFNDGDEILSVYRAEFDIIFLDIQMRFLDGMTTAEQIRAIDKDVIIIFISNMSQYAIRGYSVGALDYILKPVMYFAFSEKLKRALESLERREQKYLTVQVEGQVLRLALGRILYIESIKHYLIIFTTKGEHKFRGTMAEMESRLEDEGFFRCNRCYLVNLAHIESVRDMLVNVGGHSLQISRPRRKEFMETLTEYLGKH